MSHDGSAAVESTAESAAVWARLSPKIALALRFTSDESTRTESPRIAVESRDPLLDTLLDTLLDVLLVAALDGTGAFAAPCCTAVAALGLDEVDVGTGAATGCGPRAQAAAAMMAATGTILFTLPDLLKTKSPPKAAISACFTKRSTNRSLPRRHIVTEDTVGGVQHRHRGTASRIGLGEIAANQSRELALVSNRD